MLLCVVPFQFTLPQDINRPSFAAYSLTHIQDPNENEWQLMVVSRSIRLFR
jgi:hypothetical protein